MLIYNNKFFYNFKSQRNNLSYTVYIDEQTATVYTPIELRGDEHPFLVDWSDTNTKYSTVIASGCDMNILSQTNMQLLGLYTSDMQQYKIRLMQGSNLIWQGFLDSELYKEDFSTLDNYSVQFTGNDGFNLLDRYLFIDASGNPITGIQSAWNIIKTCFQKLNLEYTNILFASSTTSSEIIKPAWETLLHQTFLNTSNFYDESGLAMTCREVLETILSVHYLRVKQYKGGLVFFDNNLQLQTTDFIYKNHNGTTWAYVDDIIIPHFLGDVSTIGFADSQQSLEVISGINKQKLTYDPYYQKSVIDYSASEEDFSDIASAIVYNSGQETGWKYTKYNLSKYWDRTYYGYYAKREGLSTSLQNKDYSEYFLGLDKAIANYTDIYVLATNQTTAAWNSINHRYYKQLPYLIPSNTFLKVELEIYAQTKTNLNNDLDTSTLIEQIILGVNCEISDKRYGINRNTGVTAWANTSDDLQQLFLKFEDVVSGEIKDNDFKRNNISDRWLNFQVNKPIIDSTSYPTLYVKQPYLIPLTQGFSGGLLVFQIKNYYCSSDYVAQSPGHHGYNNPESQNSIKDFKIKSVKLTIVDSDGNELDQSNQEYSAYINKQYKNEGQSIKTLIGTNTTVNPLARGSIMNKTAGIYGFVKNHTRMGLTDCIENLLLRSIVSNYTLPTLKLNVCTNMINSSIGYLSYINYLSGKSFIIQAIKQDYSEETSTMTIVEASQDNLTINKTF